MGSVVVCHHAAASIPSYSADSHNRGASGFGSVFAYPFYYSFSALHRSHSGCARRYSCRSIFHRFEFSSRWYLLSLLIPTARFRVWRLLLHLRLCFTYQLLQLLTRQRQLMVKSFAVSACDGEVLRCLAVLTNLYHAVLYTLLYPLYQFPSVRCHPLAFANSAQTAA